MKTEIFAGTHQFLSPEVVDGSDNYDGTKVDIWACGVTLYSMMAGHLPFIPIEPGNFVDLYEKIGTQPLEIPAEATPDVHGLLYGTIY